MRPGETAPTPHRIKAAAVAWPGVCLKAAPAQGRGAGLDTAPRSPSRFSPPARLFHDAAAASRQKIRDISRSLPAHLLYPHSAPPKQLLIIYHSSGPTLSKKKLIGTFFILEWFSDKMSPCFCHDETLSSRPPFLPACEGG
jgi:hypothetical protein